MEFTVNFLFSYKCPNFSSPGKRISCHSSVSRQKNLACIIKFWCWLKIEYTKLRSQRLLTTQNGVNQYLLRVGVFLLKPKSPLKPKIGFPPESNPSCPDNVSKEFPITWRKFSNYFHFMLLFLLSFTFFSLLLF